MSSRRARNVPVSGPLNTAEYLDGEASVIVHFEQGFARTAVVLLVGLSRRHPAWSADFDAMRTLYETMVKEKLPDGRTRLPPLRQFRNRDKQLLSVARVTYALGLLLTTSSPLVRATSLLTFLKVAVADAFIRQLIADAMDAIYAIQLSLWMRNHAVTREFEILRVAVDRDIDHPPPELAKERIPKGAQDIVQQLQGIDYVVNFAYDHMAFDSGKKGLIVYVVALLCARVISLQDEQQK